MAARAVTAVASRSLRAGRWTGVGALTRAPSAGLVARASMSTLAHEFRDAIGSTPLLRLRVASEATGCDVYGKCEFMNPGGSVKDRAAMQLITDFEAKGLLKPGGIVVEGTAGNTGIGLVHICAAHGYRCVIFMPDTQSQEKIDLLRILGAEVRLCEAVPITDPRNFNHQARDYAESTENAVWTNQFDNTSNRDAHYATTGPEIWSDLGDKLDAFTCSTGTGGTISGVSRYLKEQKPSTQVILADPPGSVLYSWVQSAGERLERDGSSITEGIGQGRVTNNLEGTALDGAVQIPDERTIAMLYRLLKDEGIFVGPSAALNCVAAEDVAADLGPGHTVVTILCDGGDRYKSRVFSKSWLAGKGLLEHVPDDCLHLVSLP